MFLLTFSIIGLQFAWGTEVQSPTLPRSIFQVANEGRYLVDLLHTLPPLPWHVQIPHVARLDRGTPFRPRRAAHHRHAFGQEQEPIWTAAAFHARGGGGGGNVLFGAWMGKGDRGVLH